MPSSAPPSPLKAASFLTNPTAVPELDLEDNKGAPAVFPPQAPSRLQQLTRRVGEVVTAAAACLPSRDGVQQLHERLRQRYGAQAFQVAQELAFIAGMTVAVPVLVSVRAALASEPDFSEAAGERIARECELGAMIGAATGTAAVLLLRAYERWQQRPPQAPAQMVLDGIAVHGAQMPPLEAAAD